MTASGSRRSAPDLGLTTGIHTHRAINSIGRLIRRVAVIKWGGVLRGKFMDRSHSSSQDSGLCFPRLVGRTKEIINLDLALEESFSGQSWLYSVTGAPGIGKTRLATE